MSWRRILVLLVLVAGLGAYLYLYEIPQAEKEGKKDKLVAVDKDAVTGLTLVYPDREIELRKADTGWRLVKPVNAPADETVVKSLVSALADAEVQKTLDELPGDLTPFGLDKPVVSARLVVKDGTQLPPVAVGKNTAIGGKTYVRKGDEPKVFLTATSLAFTLNKQAKDLRDKQLVAFEDDAVGRIELVSATGETISLVRGEAPKVDGKDGNVADAPWTIMPGGYRADPTEVRSYLSTLRATRAVDFPDDSPTDLARYGLTAPRLTVRVLMSKEGAAPQTLLLGGERTESNQKQVYAKRGDQPEVYALGEFSYNSLNKTAGQLRDKAVIAVDPSQVQRVVIERKDGSITVSRKDGAWTVEGSEKKPKADAIARFVDDLRELRGSDIAAEPPGDLGRFGLDAPDLRVSVTDKDGQSSGTILASKRDAKYFAMKAGTNTVFEVRDYMYTRLDKQVRDFTMEDAPAGATTTLAAPPIPPDAGLDAGDEIFDEGEDFEDEHDH